VPENVTGFPTVSPVGLTVNELPRGGCPGDANGPNEEVVRDVGDDARVGSEVDAVVRVVTVVEVVTDRPVFDVLWPHPTSKRVRANDPVIAANTAVVRRPCMFQEYLVE
jgi:hypothetical protein